MRFLYRDILHVPIKHYAMLILYFGYTFRACPHLLIHLAGEHLPELLVAQQRLGVERLEALVLQGELLKPPQRLLLVRAVIDEVLRLVY